MKEIKVQGHLNKMAVKLAEPVEYALVLDSQQIELNPWIRKTVHFSFTGEICCIQCGRKTSKSFQQGYCFPCYRELLQHQLCVIHPERCLFKGKCPGDHWANIGHDKPHVVYLANTSGLKVGVTRKTQIPARWIDQGAIQALPIIETANRYEAGMLEKELKSYVNDKTNWRAMLKGEIPSISLENEREKLVQKLKMNNLQQWLSEKPIFIHYPVTEFPTKVTNLDFDKMPSIKGKLLGIKGQYLILDIGVLNVRKFGGYQLVATFSVH